MASAGQEERYFRLEERFADFKNVDNLMLPGRWTIHFDSGGSSRRIGPGAASQISQFEVTETKISHNIALDPTNFEIR